MVAGRRRFAALAGGALLIAYLAAAVLLYEAAAALWIHRPDPVPVAVGLLAVTLVAGYLSYRVGTNRLRSRLDAAEVPYRRAPDTYARLARLSRAYGVEMPTLLAARLPTPNALTIGGRPGAVVVDHRLFRMLDPAEMEALLAHELAHLEGSDAAVQTLLYSLGQALVGTAALVVVPVALVAGGLARGVALLTGRPAPSPRSLLGRLERWALALVAGLGFAVTLALLAYSRRREWAADERAVAVTGDPLALARALRKIQRAATPDVGLLTPLYVHGEDDGPLIRWLSTHPPMDERIERLLERGGTARGDEVRAARQGPR